MHRPPHRGTRKQSKASKQPGPGALLASAARLPLLLLLLLQRTKTGEGW